MAETSPKSRFELIVEATKALAWPMIAAVFLFGFWQPLHEFARLLPTLIGRSDTISIGGFSLAVGPDLASQASPQVKNVLSRIKPEELRQILAFQLASYSTEVSKYAMYPDLIALGLAEPIPPNDLKNINPDYKQGVRITSLGTDVRTFLIDILSVSLAKELKHAKNNKMEDNG